MIDAAQPAFLVAAVKQRRAPVRAEGVEQTDVAPGVAEGDQILAQQADTERCAVLLIQFPGQQRRLPVPAQQFTHWRPRTDADQTFIVFVFENGTTPCLSVIEGLVPDGASTTDQLFNATQF